MRKIEVPTAFKWDFKRESKGLHRAILDTDFPQIVKALADGAPPDARHHDHALIGDWKNYRGCHVTA